MLCSAVRWCIVAVIVFWSLSGYRESRADCSRVARDAGRTGRECEGGGIQYWRVLLSCKGKSREPWREESRAEESVPEDEGE